MKNTKFIKALKIILWTCLFGVTVFLAYLVGNYFEMEISENDSDNDSKINKVEAWFASQYVQDELKSCKLAGKQVVYFIGRSTSNFKMDYDRKFVDVGSMLQQLKSRTISKYCIVNLNSSENNNFETVNKIFYLLESTGIKPDYIIFENLMYFKDMPLLQSPEVAMKYYIKNLVKISNNKESNILTVTEDEIHFNSLLKKILWDISNDTTVTNDEFYSLISLAKTDRQREALFSNLGGIYYNAKKLQPTFVKKYDLESSGAFSRDWLRLVKKNLVDKDIETIAYILKKLINNHKDIFDNTVIGVVPHLLYPLTNLDLFESTLKKIQIENNVAVANLDYDRYRMKASNGYLELLRDGNHYNEEIASDFADKIIANILIK